MQKIILASGSKTRKRMLENAGVDFDVVPARIDEAGLKQSLIEASAAPRDIADALADAKARSVSMLNPDALVLGSDQILVHDGDILSKAVDREGARATLERLSASQHQLLSAAVVYEQGQSVWRTLDTATLFVRPLSDAFIDDYLTALGGDAFWSVGAYQLEGLGVQLFDKIQGDYFTILGLPLISILDFLRRRGMLPL